MADKSKDSTREQRIARLRQLQMKRNEARKMNHVAVVEEDKMKNLPSNWDAKRKKVDWEDTEEERRKACEERGMSYGRVKMLELSAEDAERKDLKKQRKKNPDEGFSSFEQSTFRQYSRLTRQMKPDFEEYEEEKTKLGDAFYPGTNTLGVLNHKDSKEGIDRMVSDLSKQQEKRQKYSRRRVHDDDADIDYINDRNAKFNKKLERFYGEHTAEIRQNFERGTAV
ncbi:DgyrCDS14092 [Dimorphilus gyrociliatus]|uniref:Pre-mRNA-splicing factor SYF2 n=1 Tax=Dimorphilus gyrociliatus TaxID=2664684 RepID=A0A7I8WCR1_9ANNE|nr:DgyrCDS14092 [Dimorphilus gyrociliatus]